MKKRNEAATRPQRGRPQLAPQRGRWLMVTNDVLKPIGIHKLPLMYMHKNDGDVGIPHFAFGLYPTADDAAKNCHAFTK